jgi:hypothetical protein
MSMFQSTATVTSIFGQALAAVERWVSTREAGCCGRGPTQAAVEYRQIVGQPCTSPENRMT